MPKDTKRYRYLTVGIAWDSWTLQQLEADGNLHQMEDQLAKLMVLRLTEYYKLVERGVINPGVTAMMQHALIQPIQAQPMPPMTNGDGAMPTSYHSASNGSRGGGGGTIPSLTEPETEEAATIGESANADENADAALDFFSTDFDSL